MKNAFGILFQIIGVIWSVNGVAGIVLSLLNARIGGSVFGGMVSLLLGWGGIYFGIWLRRGRQPLSGSAVDPSFGQAKGTESSVIEGERYSSSCHSRANAMGSILDDGFCEDINTEFIYRQIAEELETGEVDKAMWTRLFAECGGNETSIKVLYIKKRADFLVAEERMRLDKVAREVAVEAKRLEERERQLKLEKQRLQEVVDKEGEIIRLAELHQRNSRMEIDEKVKLLDLAGGSFVWLDRYGKCFATFRGVERNFSSGKEFSSWFAMDVVPSLLSVKKLH